MSEEPSNSTNPEPCAVTLGQFNAFLAANAPEKPCSECGTAAWGIPGDNNIVFKGMMTAGATLSGVEFYPITCRHCGFAKLYSADVVEAWVATVAEGVSDG